MKQRKMGILNDLLAKVQGIETDLGSIVKDAVEPRADTILELQKEQLLSGKASSGEDLRPYYSEDLKPGGYFKSGESAANYASWKQTLSYPYSVERNPDAPNLYINGKFHDELVVQFNPETMLFTGSSSYSQGIIAKYGISSFGLMQERWNYLLRDEGVLEEILQSLRKRLF